MGIIDDALRYLVGLGESSGKPFEIPLGDPREKTFVTNGSVGEFSLAPPPRNHQVGTIADLIRWAARFAGIEEQGFGGPVVWYDHDAVILIGDNNGHRLERATLTLIQSELFRLLCNLRKSPRDAWMEQRAFIRMLKTDLAGADGIRDLIDAVDSVEWSDMQTVRAETRGMKESMGRSITAEARTTKEPPPNVVVQVPVFTNAGLGHRVSIRCTVDVDPVEKRMRLLPWPDELAAACDSALAFVADALQPFAGDPDDNVPASGLPQSVPFFRGKP